MLLVYHDNEEKHTHTHTIDISVFSGFVFVLSGVAFFMLTSIALSSLSIYRKFQME